MKWHLSSAARCAAVVSVVIGVAGVAACADVPTSSHQPDEWADAATIGVSVRSTLRTLGPEGPTTIADVGRSDVALQFPGADSRLPGNNEHAFDKSPPHRPVIRHYRTSSGKTMSLALRYKNPGARPDMIYVFEEGTIRAVVSPTYKQHGRGYYRSRTRVTFFDDAGVPFRQADLDASAEQITSQSMWRLRLKAAEAVKDVAQLFLPQPLHAEETENCVSEWATYIAAAGVLASASAALTAAVSGCMTGVVGACAAIEKATVIWLGAMAAWNAALDRLVLCQQKTATNDAPVTDGTQTGGGGTSGGTTIDWPKLENTINTFINQAISGGNYWCSSDGNYCVYTAAV